MNMHDLETLLYSMKDGLKFMHSSEYETSLLNMIGEVERELEERKMAPDLERYLS